jgi:endothelin-converting enzyme/putative endopeptidase
VHYLRHSFFATVSILAAVQLSFSADPQSASGVDLKAMDTSINACQNFYQYACGTWRKNNPIPPDRARWGRFDELTERNQAIEREILEKAAIPAANRTAVEQKIGDFYGSCMDEAAIELKGIEPVARELDRINSIASEADVANEAARLHQQGLPVLFNFGVMPDLKNSNEQIITVDQGGLGQPDRDYYLKDDPRSLELRKQYQQNIRNMFELLAKAQGRTDADASAQSEAVMRIETALARASIDRVARRNPNNLYHIMTVDQLSSLDPGFGWQKYLRHSGIPAISRLNVSVPEFVKALNTIVSSASLGDVKTYLMWHVLTRNAELLPKAFREEDFQFFERTLRGRKEMPPRWKDCVQATDRALGEALGQKFVEVAFSGSSKAKALQLVGEIEKEMAADIQSASWMSPVTKQQAMKKLQAVSNKIGYPERWRDYSSVKILRGDYFGNAVRGREFTVQWNLAKLGKPVDKTEWGMTPPTVNAYYNPPQNNINFPAGILQPPFYNPKADDAVNYGAIGVVIGHELTHGFDDQGRRFDGEGNLRDWWTPEDTKAFEARADCVAKEYGEFSPVPGVNVNGKLTLGENAADNGGIHLAYMALMNRLAGKVLPKRDGFTPEQQFFLGYAQIWCENSTEQNSRLQAITNPHSPGQFRVNGVVQNVKEFSEAFQCKPGDPMVSREPCRVW